MESPDTFPGTMTRVPLTAEERLGLAPTDKQTELARGQPDLASVAAARVEAIPGFNRKGEDSLRR